MVQKYCKPDMVGSLSHPLPMNFYILGDECRISEPPQGATRNQLNPIHPIQAIVMSQWNMDAESKKDISKYFKIIMTNKIFPIHNNAQEQWIDVIFFDLHNAGFWRLLKGLTIRELQAVGDRFVRIFSDFLWEVIILHLATSQTRLPWCSFWYSRTREKRRIINTVRLNYESIQMYMNHLFKFLTAVMRWHHFNLGVLLS